ncbi:MAG: transcriptional repressor [Alphaproteobacteria bacterium]|nr:transcriptional repressor [Alphaproteobacteria bacterium]
MSLKRKKAERKYDSSTALLQGVGLRPTLQRLVMAHILFDGKDRHVTTEQVCAALLKKRQHVSLATVYNTLNAFTKAGLLRQTVINGGGVYFDTNTRAHHHIFDEKSRKLSDVDASSVRFLLKPKLPTGKKLEQVEVVFRVRSARDV